jgi:hypothetical protein
MATLPELYALCRIPNKTELLFAEENRRICAWSGEATDTFLDLARCNPPENHNIWL